MLCCHQAIRTLISHAAATAGLDPHRISDIGGTAGTTGAAYLTQHVQLPSPVLRPARKLADFP